MIKFLHVMKKFHNITPLKDISAEIQNGEIVSIIGPSGIGKSTLLRMINCLEKPTSGTVYVDDIEVNDKNKSLIARKVGMIFQNYNLFNHLTVVENIMIAQIEILKNDKQAAYDKSIELLREVGLKSKENSYPKELSGGEKQRIAFVRALAMDPEVLLLDEPTSALDPNSVSIIENLILNIAKSGKTILMVTHSMKLAKDISDRVFYIDEGIIYEEGTPEEIFENPKKPNTQNFINNHNSIEFKIDKMFDFVSVSTKIIEFCAKHKINLKLTNRILLVCEETKQILFEKYNDPNIIVKLSIKNDDANIIIKYKGEKFDIKDTKNNISLKLIEGIALNIKYSFNENEEYENELVVGINLSCVKI